jgi:ABC-2 type transport system ATP-binding protein
MTDISNDPVIELDGLTVRYGKRTALDNVSARVIGGAIGLLGPNGAGKSSLIKALLGLVPVHSGKARVLGRDLGKRTSLLRRRIGYMPERDAAFPGLTGFQATWYAGRLAGMPDADARRRAHEVLLFAGLEEARYREVVTYSTGMRQRVRLAQALVHDPDLLFLDEPTNGLDPKGREEMLALIAVLSQSKGIHVVLSSHLLRDVEEVCDQVVVVRNGTIVKQASIEELAHATDDAVEVTVEGDVDGFLGHCTPLGLTLIERKKHDQVQLRLGAEANPRDVFAAAEQASVLVRGVVPVRIPLEDALLDVLGGGDAERANVAEAV